ncbi:ribosome silencing factor [Guyparkeria hydrothermalis]|uniref:ribosome silencing factor n=1 Tax=Guyparkeria hydrothermalis TaxID=923 RepID=UPI002020C850|nr:ribosome silencing factor [Guyparkeria hydrothermalis]MCL7744237.1 ribosome silencing factor [Guyparkeria hydrothermalis]
MTANQPPSSRTEPVKETPPMPAEEILEHVVTALENLKAVDLVKLDVRERCNFTDYMVFASGTSDRHLRAMADEAVKELKKHGMRPMNVEGDDTPQTEWVLVDFIDVIVHLMMPETRTLYQLEKLWSAPAADPSASDS